MQIIEEKTKGRRLPVKRLKIDMTPMVDLGFLLITFFIFTTTMADPHVMKIYMPADGMDMRVKQTESLTLILIDEKRVGVYEGSWEEAKHNNAISISSYDVYQGMGNFIRSKQKKLRTAGKDPSRLMVLIKPLDNASYANVINALDEMLINGVKRYAIIDADKEEKAWFETSGNNMR